MRASTLEIVWHKKEAIHAFDTTLFKENQNALRVASGGVDCMVRIWLISQDNVGKSTIDHRATLNRHERGVGAVRFCPVMRDNQIFLATAADDSIIIIWKYEPGRAPMQTIGDGDEEENNQECWITSHTLRGHIEDVSDLSWSSDGTKLASSGIDHSVIIWDTKEGKKLAMCQNHSHYVQGIAIDPFGTLVASLSADRSIRFYEESKKTGKDRYKTTAMCNKVQLPGYCRPVRLWWDDTLPGFVRRLSWSPDGLLLAAPSGEINPAPLPLPPKNEDGMKVDDQKIDLLEAEKPSEQKKNSVCVFTRGNRRDPAFLLNTPEPTMVARWCPKLFKLRSDCKQNVLMLDYRMIFAVSTTDSIILYDTQTMTPCSRISDIHYATMTDLAWSHNGQSLFVSSRDGYVTRVDFTPEEIGEEYEKSVGEVLQLVSESLNRESDDMSDEDDRELNPLDRLSPQIERMKLKNEDTGNITPKAKTKKRIAVSTVAATDSSKSIPEKKPKKKVAITTISPVPE